MRTKKSFGFAFLVKYISSHFFGLKVTALLSPYRKAFSTFSAKAAAILASEFPTFKIVMSSAYPNLIRVLLSFRRGLKYNINRTGKTGDPYGTLYESN